MARKFGTAREAADLLKTFGLVAYLLASRAAILASVGYLGSLLLDALKG